MWHFAIPLCKSTCARLEPSNPAPAVPKASQALVKQHLLPGPGERLCWGTLELLPRLTGFAGAEEGSQESPGAWRQQSLVPTRIWGLKWSPRPAPRDRDHLTQLELEP